MNFTKLQVKNEPENSYNPESSWKLYIIQK